MRPVRKETWFHGVIVFIFIAAITIPLAKGQFVNPPTQSSLEKRTLAAFPPFPDSMAAIEKYPAKLEAFFQDHFGFRKQLAYLYNIGKFKLGDSPCPDVLLGKQGWLFLNGERYLDPVGDYRNKNLYTRQALETVASQLAAKNNWLKKRGVRYFFVIAPNKHTIYPEKLPDYINKVSEISAVDQIMTYMRRYPDVAIIDLRRPLLAAKKTNTYLYYPTDTHWNHHGANIAQYEIARAVASFFPADITPVLYTPRFFSIRQKKVGDLAIFIGLPMLFNEYETLPDWGSDACCQKHIPADHAWRGPFSTVCERRTLTALFFRDSFFSAVQPFMSTYFQRATYIWEYISYDALVRHVENESPDIVIEEMVERIHPLAPPLDQRFFELDKES